eukprot:m.233995 g.233995  ORF g.233995 m.233995 type:complete len:242 (-) comp18911_c0_seq6:38-763(-)
MLFRCLDGEAVDVANRVIASSGVLQQAVLDAWGSGEDMATLAKGSDRESLAACAEGQLMLMDLAHHDVVDDTVRGWLHNVAARPGLLQRAIGTAETAGLTAVGKLLAVFLTWPGSAQDFSPPTSEWHEVVLAARAAVAHTLKNKRSAAGETRKGDDSDDDDDDDRVSQEKIKDTPVGRTLGPLSAQEQALVPGIPVVSMTWSHAQSVEFASHKGDAEKTWQPTADQAKPDAVPPVTEDDLC